MNENSVRYASLRKLRNILKITNLKRSERKWRSLHIGFFHYAAKIHDLHLIIFLPTFEKTN